MALRFVHKIAAELEKLPPMLPAVHYPKELGKQHHDYFLMGSNPMVVLRVASSDVT